MKKKNIYIILSLCCLFAACQKIIKIDLKSVTPQLVIEGYVSDLYGTEVTLSKTVDFYADNNFPPVRNAKVVLTDLTRNRKDSLKETSPGVYTLGRKGIPGNTYQLYVNIDGDAYTATSTMPLPIHPDSITFARRTIWDLHIINTIVHFQDPASKDNYYLFREFIYKNRKGKNYSFSDRLSDGKYISYTLENDSAYLQPQDSVLISMHCIDKANYTYFNVLESISADDSGFGSSAPANPPNNFDKNVLGIFSAQTDYLKKVYVPKTVPNE